jgi:mono/diheme cytochrome c family protein
MPIFLIKSILALGLLLLTLVGLFTMFEIYGRPEKRFNVSTLIRIHRINGFLYLILFFIISYFCLRFLADTKADFSPRSALHTLLALAIFVLLCFKIVVVSVYRGFYGKLQQVGPWLALATFLLIGTSAGYYLLVTDLGREKRVAKILEEGKPKEVAVAPAKVGVSTDPRAIARGKELFQEKCTECHYPDSTRTLVGPGLKGVLKNALLPRSGKPATPEAILNQLRNPYMLMPSFSYLSDDDALGIVAFLNTF